MIQMKHSGENGESSCIKDDGHILVTSNMEQSTDAGENTPNNSTPQDKIVDETSNMEQSTDAGENTPKNSTPQDKIVDETSNMEPSTDARENTPNNSTPQDKIVDMCRICLATDRKMYTLYTSSLRTGYENCTGLKVNLTDELPKMLCWECRHRLVSCGKFVDRAKHADMVLRNLISDGCSLSFNELKSIDTQKENLKSNLSPIIHPPNDFYTNILEASLLESMNMQIETDVKTDSLKQIETLTETDVKEGIIDESNEQANFEQSETYSPEYLNEYELDMTESDIDLNEDDSKDPTQLTEPLKKTESTEEINYEYLIDNEMNAKESDLDQNDDSIDTIRYVVSIETEANEEIMNVSDEHANFGQFETNTPEYLTDSETDIKEIVLGLNKDVSISPEEYVEIPIETDEWTNLGQSKIDSLEFMTDNQLDIKETVLEDASTDTKCREIENVQMCAKNKMQKGNMNETNITIEKETKATPLNPEVFSIIDLSYNEQIREIEKRKESSNYKYSPFKCEECYKGFVEEDMYNLHMLKHSTKHGTFICGICKVYFNKLRALRKHIKIHAKKFSCKYCPYVTTGMQSAKLHEVYHATYKCPQCPETFVKLTTYMSHMQMKHPSDFDCELCGISFTTENRLLQHKSSKHRFDGLALNEEGPSCSECDIQFASERAFKIHLKLSNRHKIGQTAKPQEEYHTGTTYKCPQCPETFVKHTTYMSHVRIKHPSNFECELCGNSFISENRLLQHKRLKHGFDEQVLTEDTDTGTYCKKCDIEFASERAFKIHSKLSSRHKNGKLTTYMSPVRIKHPSNFECELCGNSFISEKMLLQHKRLKHDFDEQTQTEEIPYCKECDVEFTSEKALKIHLKLSNSHKNSDVQIKHPSDFVCELCGKSFISEKRLFKHKNLNHRSDELALTGEGLHCEECDVYFASEGALKIHLKLSNSHKNSDVQIKHPSDFVCELCDKSFTSEKRLLQHKSFNHRSDKLALTEEGSYCKECDVHFASESALKSHLKSSNSHKNSDVQIKHPSDFVCELCDKSFTSEKKLLLHKRLKHLFDEQAVTHRFDEQAVTHRFDEQALTEQFSYCKECEVEFASERAFKIHMKLSKRHKNRLEPKVRKRRRRIDSDTSSDNKESSNDKRNNTKNVKTDQKRETPISCEQCEMQLPDYTSYYKHFRSAHPDKNRTNYASKNTHFMCEMCGRICKNSALLKDHMLIHSGLKQFECPLCHKMFQRRYSLVNHRRLHRRPKGTHQCNICKKMFGNSYNLKRHRLIHTGLKPFKCEACGKCFKDRHDRGLHYSYVHLKKPWPKRTRKKPTNSQQQTQ